MNIVPTRWYVIGSMPTYFEKEATNAIEEYTWNDREKRIDINFSFNRKVLDGPIARIPQKGYIYDTSTNAEWRVSPFWPFRLPFLIIMLPETEVTNEPYSYTVIGYPSREYVWIMARKPVIDDDLYNDILNKLKTEHLYDTTGIKKILHSNCL